MDLEVKWHQPIPLVDGSDENLILNIENLEDIHTGSGVYMFCRRYNSSINPLYIGKSMAIKKRISQHLNSVKMMKGIQRSQNGEKVLVVGELVSKSGQRPEKSIDIIETALIEHALLEGYELLNEQGTKRPTHQITFKGYLGAKQFSSSKQVVTVKASRAKNNK